MTTSTFQASVCMDNRNLVVTDSKSDDSQLMFPFPWLRYNCQCSDCFHPVTKTRSMLMQSLDPDVIPTRCQVDDSNTIEITWPDDHTSMYEYDWLKEHRFTEAASEHRLKTYSRTPVLWGAEMKEKLLKIKFNEILNDKKSLYRWITAIEDHGICLLTEAPTESGMLFQIGQKVAHLRMTNYGDIYTLKALVKPTNIAYTSATLSLHADFPYFEHTPGVQMIHCISQVESTGGDNMFSDGFRVVQALAQEHPEEYRLLTTLKLDYRNVGEDKYKFHLKRRVPVIQLDWEGKVVKFNYNTTALDTVMNLPLEQVRPMFKAMATFDRLLHEPRFCIQFKLEPGQIVCFHNGRLLHGRLGFQVTSDGERHLEGAYMDWDEIRSRRRVLEKELGWA